MQRIQAQWLLRAAFVALALSACNSGSKPRVPTVADYLHDIDRARAHLDLAHTNPSKYENDPATMNASEAMVQITYASMKICWRKPISTATTDHECLDKKGFKRS